MLIYDRDGSILKCRKKQDDFNDETEDDKIDDTEDDFIEDTVDEVLLLKRLPYFTKIKMKVSSLMRMWLRIYLLMKLQSSMKVIHMKSRIPMMTAPL